MILRRLGVVDVGLWCAIRDEALRLDPRQLAPRDGGPPPEARADFSARLREGAVWAVLDGSGILAVAARGSDAADPRRVWLQSLYTRHEARGRGHARCLISAIESDAAGAGAHEVWLEVGQGNGPAIGLYVACGYAVLREGAETMVLRKKLVPPA